MAWYDNPAFGVYGDDVVDREDNQPGRFGGPYDNGKSTFCKECLKHNFYQSLYYIDKKTTEPCPACKKRRG
jgi:hypothetical protein